MKKWKQISNSKNNCTLILLYSQVSLAKIIILVSDEDDISMEAIT